MRRLGVRILSPALDIRPLVYDVDNVEHPKAVGDRSTLAVMLALQGAGFAVLLPFGENTRYDFVIDLGTTRCGT
jgi:hypothetical protein